jgi:hypothetical protein
MNLSHERIETNPWLLIVLVLLVVSVGGLVQIVPLFFQKSTTEPVTGLKPYAALAVAGRDIYVREGCYNCHSQMIRPFRAETLRYGSYSVAGESVYDHPFQWGSKRTGPDLARVGGRYNDEWHRIPPDQPARSGARVEHAFLPLAGERSCGWRAGRAAHEGAEGRGPPVQRRGDRRSAGGCQGPHRTRRAHLLYAGSRDCSQVKPIMKKGVMQWT